MAPPNPPSASRHYDANYGNFQTELYAQIRREAFGDDIGQSSWITATEQDKFLPPLNLFAGKTLLDVACGSGGPALRIAEKTGCSLVGIDVHVQAVETANSLAAQRGLEQRAKFQVVDATSQLPFPAAAFDAITCIDAINHLYDGANALEELDNSGSVSAKYVHTLYVDEPVAELHSGITSYYQQDIVGSVSSLSNPSGALTNTYSYDSFGSPTTSIGTLINPFRYTGRELDSETGLQFLRARYYGTNAGRFLSEDPIAFRGGMNFYPYVRNSPIGLADIFGLAAGTPDWLGGLQGLFPGSELQSDSSQGPFLPFVLRIHLPCREVIRILRENGYADSDWGYDGLGSAFDDPFYMNGGFEWRTHGPGNHLRMPYFPGTQNYQAQDGTAPKDCSSSSCTLDHFHTDPHNPIDGHRWQHFLCDFAHVSWGWLCN